jgi:hypothetical protein
MFRKLTRKLNSAVLHWQLLQNPFAKKQKANPEGLAAIA